MRQAMVLQHEKEIIAGCRKGRREAQKQLYDMYARKMLALCFRYCDTVEEAEDVLQEGFIRVFTQIGQYRSKGSFEGWIRKIMVNCALNYLRTSAAYRFTEDLSEVPDVSQPAEMPFNSMELSYVVEKIRELPPGYRAIFNLFEVEGYSHQEIGEMLCISANTSKSQLRKARKQLQEKLSDYNDNR